MARRICELVPALSSQRLANYSENVGYCKRVVARGVRELRFDSRHALGRGGAIGVVLPALFERAVACLGHREITYAVAWSVHRDFALRAFDDCAV